MPKISSLPVLLLGASLAALATAASAQELVQVAQLETVTVTATRMPQSAAEVPSTVSVISAEDIRNEFITDIKRLVDEEPGVSVRTQPARFTAAGAATGRDGNSGFNIRGLEGNRVLILTDGIRLPDAFSFGAQAVGRGDYVDLDTIKSVEILRGPASALYGSDGVAGAVAFITKDPVDYLKNGRTLAVQGTTGYTSADKQFANNLLVAGQEGEWEGMISYTRRDGHEMENKGTDNSANVNRTTPNPQDISSNAVLGKIVWSPNTANRIRLTYDYQDSFMRANVLSAIALPPLAATSTLGLTARDSSTRGRISLDETYAGAAGDFIESASAAIYYQMSKTLQTSNEDRNTAADRTRINTFNNKVYGFTGQAQTHFMTGNISHLVIVGADASIARQDGIRDGTVPPAGESFPTRAFPNTDFTLAGFFVQDEIKFLNETLLVYPGARVDYYSLQPKADALLVGLVPSGQSKSRVSPKLGVVYKFLPDWNVFANYAQGFKAPSPSQVNNAFSNLVANYRSVPNPNLKPETSESIEGGVRYDTSFLSLSGTVFSGQYRDFIDQVQAGGTFTPTDPGIFQYVNQGSVHIRGAEAKGTIRFGGGFDGLLGVSFTHGNAINAGVRSPLDSIDPIKLVGGLGYRDPGNVWGARFSVTHSEGKELSRISAGLCAPAACFAPPAFTTLDATGYWNISENFTVRAGVFNLFDEKYIWWSDVRGLAATSPVIDSYTQPGRNFGVSLTARL